MSYQQSGRQLVTQQSQQMNEQVRVQRSKFVTEWSHLKPFDAGFLYPFLLDEVYPGDVMKYDVQAFVRMATMVFPQFSQQQFETFFFFVPTRLTWTGWERFMGEQVNPGDSIAYTIPQVAMPAGGAPVGSLMDHFGIPTVGQIAAGATLNINALPLRCYFLIYNEYFRDQDLINSVSVPLGDGPDAYGNYNPAGSTTGLLRRAKFHDYFTTLRPWPQKFTAPSVPLAGTAWVKGIGFGDLVNSVTQSPVYESPSGPSTTYTEARTGVDLYVNQDPTSHYPQVYADLASATGVNVNLLRQAVLIQQILERDARSGTRYVETVKAHFDVMPPDYRLQRPEYIGGGRSPLNVTAVAQTATGGGGVAALGGAGTFSGAHRASYAAQEHGYIIGILNVRTELIYSQGLHRFWSRSTRFDFYYPLTAGLGEQAVYQRELYARGDSSDLTVMGYSPRWDELRTRYSEAVGVFRPTAASNIDEWHLGEQFATAPTLNATFIQDAPPVSRVLSAGAAANGQQYLADILIRRTAVRPLPMYGRPLTFGAI